MHDALFLRRDVTLWVCAGDEGTMAEGFIGQREGEKKSKHGLVCLMGKWCCQTIEQQGEYGSSAKNEVC